MKKIIIPLMTALALSAGTASAMNGAEVKINVVVNGSTLEFEDQQPIIISGRTLLPIRGVMEAIGAEVGWNAEAQRVEITDGGTTVYLTINSNEMKKITESGEETITLDAPPMIFNARTCLPVRAVAEAFGAAVGWDGATSTVTVDKAATEGGNV